MEDNKFKSPRKQLLEEIFVSMGELQRCFATSRDSFLAQFKLSRPQLELLFSLKHGPSSTKDLAETFGISSSAVSQMIDQLEKKELVERFNNNLDRRVTYVKLGGKAQKEFKAFKLKFIEQLNSRFTNVSQTNLANLDKILKRIIKDLT
jgi:DNA-binding MarR family transcriptional regulator